MLMLMMVIMLMVIDDRHGHGWLCWQLVIIVVMAVIDGKQ